MSTDAIGSATSSSSAALSNAIQQSGGQKLNEQDFLQLLTTQLSNQDPTNPVDDSQLASELAQFSTVEGITNLQTTQSQQQAMGLLGQTIIAQTSANNISQMVTGKVTSVSWDSTGVHVNIAGSNANITLDQIVQVDSGSSSN